jgi:hypothetical protein
MGIMRNRLRCALAAMLALAAVSASADDRRTARGTGPAASTRTTTILGAAWNADSTPIKGAHLRLRNVVTGKIEGVTKANEAGQFTFENIEGGSYVVELVTESGHVLTVGHVFTIARGETVATFVRLAPKVPWAQGFFSSSAAAVAATAATEGIAAITPTGRCQSPPCQ